jgi:AcrR family transcriptional regulator
MSIADIMRYNGPMGRWEPDARGRLQAAALDLYGERGYEQTTVAEIAARAGLTERTFFRHFADKREVLFAGSSALQEQLVGALEAAPASLSAIDAVARALAVVTAAFPVRREYARRRHAVIAANPDLQERERIKLASLAAAFAGALRRRGVVGTAATLAGEMGAAIFRVAFERWIDDAHSGDLQSAVRESLGELKTLTG